MATISNIIKSKTSTSAILDGIQFNSITHTGFGEQVLWVKGSNIWQTSADSATDIPFAVNGVDINWNSAEWPSDIGNYVPTTINTTGDLLKAIKYASTHGGSTLSPATSTVLGGIKTGFTQSDQNKNYPVKLDSNNNAYVNVPWINTEYNDGNLIDIDNKNINHGIPTNIDDPDNPNDGDVPYGDPDGDNGDMTFLASITRDKYGHIIDAQTITLTRLKGLLGLFELLVKSTDITYNSMTLTAYVNDKTTGVESLANNTIWSRIGDNIIAYDANGNPYTFGDESYSYMLTIQRNFNGDTDSYSTSVNYDDIYYVLHADSDPNYDINDALSTNSSDPTILNSGLSYWMPDYNSSFKLTINQEWDEASFTVNARTTEIPGVSENDFANEYQGNVTFPSHTNIVDANIGDSHIKTIGKSNNLTYLGVDTYDMTIDGKNVTTIKLTNNYGGNNDLTGYLTVTMAWNYASKVWEKDFKYYITLKGTPTVYPVNSISLDKSSLSVAANGTGTITATITPNNATNKGVNWNSSDPTVATVTASTISGNAATVTWKKAGGPITITATAAGDTSKTAQCTVTCEAQTYYYYYAGWTQPTESNIDTIITETYPASSEDSTQHTAGKKTTIKSEMNYANNTLYNANDKIAYYVLVPPTQTIVDPEDNSSVLSVFTSQGTITVGNLTHTVYKYNGTTRNIGAIKIY